MDFYWTQSEQNKKKWPELYIQNRAHVKECSGKHMWTKKETSGTWHTFNLHPLQKQGGLTGVTSFNQQVNWINT